MGNKKAMEQGDFQQIQVISDPVIMPDGDAVAFVMHKAVDDTSYQSNIFLQQLAGKQACVPWTCGTSKNSAPRFSPDGTQMVFESDRSGTGQLWMMPTTGGEARQITTFANGAIAPYWMPDGRKLIFTASLEADDEVHTQKEKTKEEKQQTQEAKNKKAVVIDRLQYKAEGTGLKDTKKTHLVMYDVKTAAFEQLTKADEHHFFQDVSPDGRRLLFVANLDEDDDYTLRNALYELDLATGEITMVTKEKHTYGGARYAPDGEKIVLLGHKREYRGATQNEMYLLDAEGNLLKTLSEDWDFQIGDVMIGDMRLGSSETGPVWSKDGKRIFFIKTEKGATQLCAVDLEGNLDVLYDENNHVFGFAYHEEKDHFVLGISSPELPCDLVKLDRDGSLEQLTAVNNNFLEETAVVPVEEVHFQAEDGV